MITMELKKWKRFTDHGLNSNNMREIILKIVTRKEIDFEMTRKEMIAFPTRYCKQVIFEEKLITVEYKPAPPLGFDEKGFIDLVKSIFKRTLGAHSVDVVERGYKELEG